MAEIQCFDQDVEEATAQVLTKFISKSELGEIGSLVNEICTHRINVAIEKRDDMWRQHETAQISFLQNENSQMLTGLHAEIERLHHRLRGNGKLYPKLQKTEQNMDKLNQELQKCEKKSRDLEQKTSGTIRMLKNQLAYQGNRIRQLTDELSERTAQITKLMAQLPFGTVAEITGNEVPARIHFYSQPTIPWNPAPASFFGKKDNNFSHASLIRNVSITYPGGRPNVVARKYNYTPTTPRSHHLPSLYSKPRSAPLFGHNIEKPTQLQMLELRDRMSFTRSLYEIRNPFTANSITSKNSKASISVDESTQNTI
ncbi:hypothetical protein WUBG_03631 [Wuchereria bancrofti]|uniref:CCDC92/74 N-terminal domain-containing protein n=1 Tax=Wuchereria bancrofti TaxID=6293 RepID=J9FDL2_WUCBA|nr:hypothetical protein WUBG_03631 [Wuchereria bancrofti]